MSDEPKKRSSAWLWWSPLGALALYLLSCVPVVLATAWLAKAGVISDQKGETFVETLYAPLVWAQKNSQRVDQVMQWIGGIIRPLAPP